MTHKTEPTILDAVDCSVVQTIEAFVRFRPGFHGDTGIRIHFPRQPRRHSLYRRLRKTPASIRSRGLKDLRLGNCPGSTGRAGNWDRALDHCAVPVRGDCAVCIQVKDSAPRDELFLVCFVPNTGRRPAPSPWNLWIELGDQTACKTTKGLFPQPLTIRIHSALRRAGVDRGPKASNNVRCICGKCL